MDRRTFLKRSGLVAGGGAMATQLPYNMIGSAEAADVAKEKTGVEIKRTICTHCSVGCAVDAVLKTASGCVRNRSSIRRSTSARTVPRVRRCANTATANIV
jgi:anaerobic selenocysteine-containing dehydrogenase